MVVIVCAQLMQCTAARWLQVIHPAVASDKTEKLIVHSEREEAVQYAP
jgi:hypothetical protein